jgi:predicted Zn-ribbon and HTH transcriptional regulator
MLIMRKKYGVCPYCGSEKTIICSTSEKPTTFKHLDTTEKHLDTSKKHLILVQIRRCGHCGETFSETFDYVGYGH